MAAKCPADEYCLKCEGTGTDAKCLTCAHSYLDNGECKAPTTKKDNCIAYASATACSGCDKGYRLSSGSCVKITLDKCLAQVGDNCVLCEDDK